MSPSVCAIPRRATETPYAAIASTKRRNRTVCLVLTPCSGCVAAICSSVLIPDRAIIRFIPQDRRELRHCLRAGLLTVVIGTALQGVGESQRAREDHERAR